MATGRHEVKRMMPSISYQQEQRTKCWNHTFPLEGFHPVAVFFQMAVGCFSFPEPNALTLVVLLGPHTPAVQPLRGDWLYLIANYFMLERGVSVFVRYSE